MVKPYTRYTGPARALRQHQTPTHADFTAHDCDTDSDEEEEETIDPTTNIPFVYANLAVQQHSIIRLILTNERLGFEQDLTQPEGSTLFVIEQGPDWIGHVLENRQIERDWLNHLLYCRQKGNTSSNPIDVDTLGSEENPIEILD